MGGFIEFNSLDEAITFGLNETALANGGIDGEDPAFKNIQQSFSCCGVSTICDGFEVDFYEGCECDVPSDNCAVVPTERPQVPIFKWSDRIPNSVQRGDIRVCGRQ